MAQDIRKLMQEQPQQASGLATGHEARFEARLNKEFSPNKKNTYFFWLKVAAIVVVFFSIGYVGYQKLSLDPSNTIAETPSEKETTENANMAQITLGDISPDLKKVEDFYLTGINVQLASLDQNDENKELITGYLLRLGELDTEYTALNKELNEVGPTEATITALIDNLKLRLELLFKLKNKLKELKNQNNEQVNSIEA
jgi:hypothetical protein